jgi:hypothetical protein
VNREKMDPNKLKEIKEKMEEIKKKKLPKN